MEVFYTITMKLLLVITGIICYTLLRGVWFHHMSNTAHKYKADMYLEKHKKEAKKLVVLVIILLLVVIYLINKTN
jgi:heme/copper-type cytochrome/quinol oxidase subunit 2